ncbi:MAG: TOMM precursor leader peptide-binding protein [Pseudomonadota bacterium]
MPSIERPVIKSKYLVVPVAGEGIYLLGENEKHVLEGNTMMQMVPLLDGQRGWQEIHAALAPSLGADAVGEGINILLAHAHVEEAVPEERKASQIFWTELGLSAQATAAFLAQTNIHVLTLGQVDPRIAYQGLASLGLRSDPGRVASFTVVLTDDYENPELAQINRHMLASGAAWMLIKPGGLLPLAGPIFRPHAGPCWSCLATWLRHNREVEGYVRRRTQQPTPFQTSRAHVPLGETQAVSLALLQMARMLVRAESPLMDSRLVAIDTLSGEQTYHFVPRRPQCPDCGDPALARVAGRPVVLNEALGRVANENGFRPETPETTFARYQHLVSPLMGVIKGVYPVPMLTETPIRSYMAGHNFALKNDHIAFLKDGLRSNSSGKGKTDAQARTSALCEALERYSGTFRREEEVIEASLNELGDEAVDPTTVMLYSERQYAARDEWNATGSRFSVVPQAFDPDAKIMWSPVWSWTQERRRLIPTSLAYYNVTDVDGAFYCWGDSNGAAAGGNLEDALLQGALEVIERDGVAIWWMNRLSRPAVDLDSFEDPYIDEMRAFYGARGRAFWVLDLTNDVGIPCMAAVNRRTSGPTEDIVMGFGAHLDPRIALSRCITEMNQFMPAVLHVGEDGVTHYAFDDPDTLNWWRTATLENQPYIAPSEAPAKTPCDYDFRAEGSVSDNVRHVFGRFEDLGHEVLILDQTRPDIGLPVAKVIVPGMRHFWARHAPGRLYDVPVRMGWLDQALTEDDLNPVAMFI